MKTMMRKSTLYFLALGGAALLSQELSAMEFFKQNLGNVAGFALDGAKQLPWAEIGKGAKDAFVYVAEGTIDTATTVANKVSDKMHAMNQAEKARIEREALEQLDVCDETIRNPRSTEAAIAAALQEKSRILNKKNEQLSALNKSVADVANGIIKTAAAGIDDIRDTAKKLFTENIERGTKVAVAEATAKATEEARGAAMLQKAREDAQWYVDNKWLLIGGTVAIIGSYFVFKHGVPFLIDRYKIPELAQETSLLSMKDRLSNWLTGVTYETDIAEVKFSPELTDRLHGSAHGLKQMVANGSILQNKLFYGPPGTGKTEFARRLARWSEMDFVYFSAGDLEQMDKTEATRKVTSLFVRAQYNSKPLMIVLDEADLVLGHRYNKDGVSDMNDTIKAVNNQFLTYTGKGNSNYMVVAISNHPDKMDDAFLSRCDEQILFDAPNAESRREILDLYLDKYLINGAHLKLPERATGLSKFMSYIFPATRVARKVDIEDGALSEDARQSMAKNLEGWVGRDIEQFVTAIETVARSTPACTVTPDVINKALRIKKTDLEIKKKGFQFKRRA